MNDCLGARRRRMSPRDRQMLGAAYAPVIAFAAVLLAARISRTRRHQVMAVVR